MARDDVPAAFEAFHLKHPHVLGELADIARELVAAGVKPGVASIWTVLYQRRYRAMLDRAQKPPGLVTTNDDPVNDYAPFYARLIHAVYVDLDGFLKLGRQRAWEGWNPVYARKRLGLSRTSAHGGLSAGPALPPPPPLP
jgi:hypothetical protein